MEELKRILESDEEILWTKTISKEKHLPNKNSRKLYYWIYLIITILMNSVIILELILHFFPEKFWFLFYICMDVSLTITVPIIIYLAFKEEDKKYLELSKQYSDEQLREYKFLCAITNKNFIKRALSGVSSGFSSKELELVKPYSKFQDDFIILDHSKLRAIKITKIGWYFVKLDFNHDTPLDLDALKEKGIKIHDFLNKMDKGFGFHIRLKKTELAEFLRVIKGITKNVVVEFEDKDIWIYVAMFILLLLILNFRLGLG